MPQKHAKITLMARGATVKVCVTVKNVILDMDRSLTTNPVSVKSLQNVKMHRLLSQTKSREGLPTKRDDATNRQCSCTVRYCVSDFGKYSARFKTRVQKIVNFCVVAFCRKRRANTCKKDKQHCSRFQATAGHTILVSGGFIFLDAPFTTENSTAYIRNSTPKTEFQGCRYPPRRAL